VRLEDLKQPNKARDVSGDGTSGKQGVDLVLGGHQFVFAIL